MKRKSIERKRLSRIAKRMRENEYFFQQRLKDEFNGTHKITMDGQEYLTIEAARAMIPKPMNRDYVIEIELKK